MSIEGPNLPPPGTPGPPPGDTSSQVGAPQFQLATWLQRVGGAFIDAAIVWAILMVGIVLSGGDTNGVLYTLANLAGLAFTIWQQWRQGLVGQTIGKRLMGLKVVSEANAEVIGGPMSIVRWLCHIADALCCFVGYLFPIWDRKRQTFADKIIKTVVVYNPR